MIFKRFSVLPILLVLIFPGTRTLFAQEVRGLKIYVDLAAGTYLKFQKPIDGIEGTFREKGYNFKNRSGGNALNIVPPTDRALEPAEIEISEGGRNHLFIITPYPGKYNPNIDPPFDYILDNNDKVKKFAKQAEDERASLAASGGTNGNGNTGSGSSQTDVASTQQPDPEPPRTYTAPDPPLIKNTPANDGYDEQIAIADKAFLDKDFYKAKAAYAEAYRIRLNEKYPLTRIQLITKIEEEATAKIKELEEKQKVIDANYSAELQKADRYLLNGEYSLARETYTNAAQIKPGELYPKNKIAEIDKLVKDLLARQEEERKKAEEEKKRLAAEKELNDRYNTAVAKADKAFASRQYDVARLAYSDALKIKPGEKYPDDKLTEIAEIKNANEAAEAERLVKEREKALTAKYESLIAQGDKAMEEKQFDAAKKSYNEALALKPSENLAQAKLADLVVELNRQKEAELERLAKAKQKELDDNYNAAIAKADKAFAAKNYETAKTAYYNAQSIKPGETYPQEQLTAIDTKIAEQAAAIAREKEISDKYFKAVTDADNAFKNKNYADARLSYNAALELKPDDAYARGKIAMINKIESDLAIQRRQAAEKALNEKYEAAIAKADKAFADGDYTVAKQSYQSAIDLIPQKEFPANQIRLIDRKILEQQELEKTRKYNELIAQADKAFTDKSYNSAKEYYTKALEIKPGEIYPKKQIDIVNDPGQLERMAKMEDFKKYNQYVDDGDKAFKAAKYDDAKKMYSKALEIKPEVPYLVYKLNQIQEAIDAERMAAVAKQQAEAQKALDEKFDKIVSKADKSLEDGNLDEAKKSYNEALALKPNDAAIADKIKNIDDRIAKAAAEALAKEKEAALNATYRDLISKADNAFDSKDYAVAKKNYESAILIKPDDSHSRERLDAIEKSIAKAEEAERLAEISRRNAEEKENNYNAAIERANKALDAKLYFEAKAGYQDALAIKPGEKFPATKLAEVEKALAKISAENAAAKAAAAAETKPTVDTRLAGSTLEVQKAALPYNQAQLYMRYNTINFREPPRGQKLAADAFFIEDTLKNFSISNRVIAEQPAHLDMKDSANDVVLTLQAINFEGSNAYFKFRIQNFGKKEFLAGRMLLTWHRKDGSTLDYYAAYITSYPYVLPGKEFTIVYVARSATLAAGEGFSFVMEDRLKTTELELYISDKVYNSEFER